VSDRIIAQLRSEAKRRGLRWSDVLDAYRDAKAAEIDKRRRPNEVRQTAWWLATASTPGSWPFWRHGFAKRWGARVDRGDYTAVPGYDEIAQAIATQFPEYAGDDGTERLFDFLLSPYDRIPGRPELLERALDRAEQAAATDRTDPDAAPVPADF